VGAVVGPVHQCVLQSRRASRSHLGDVDGWIDAVERFTTGVVAARAPATIASATKESTCAHIRLLGGFNVAVGTAEVPTGAWGSRRARQLCKRLAIACGAPVARDALIELLWPDAEDVDKLGARLSVELSRVRRVLGGGVIADRSSVRLDLRDVSLDLAEFRNLLANDDLDAAIGLYRGDVLPEDAYDDWAMPVRDDTRVQFAIAAHRCADQAARSGDHGNVCALASRILATDPYDEPAHHRLIVALTALNRFGDARHACQVYVDKMADIGVAAAPIEQMITPRPVPRA
jgi:DNA-binding SARP family transcriptional activator